MPLQNASTAERSTHIHTGRPLRRDSSSGHGARALLEWRTQAEAHGASLVGASPQVGVSQERADWPTGEQGCAGLWERRRQWAFTEQLTCVCRAVPGSKSQPGGADNAGLPKVNNRRQRHWKPGSGRPPNPSRKM